ncbi:MAG: hypothetical protein ACU85V_16515 [Gammaproteobacteria bacterium]
MTNQDLEHVFTALADKIDEVGPANSELLLAKVVLLLAHRNGDAADVETCIEEAAASFGAA